MLKEYKQVKVSSLNLGLIVDLFGDSSKLTVF